MRLENKPPDDEGWSGGEILARYESGVMLFLLILSVTIVALLVWLGAYPHRPVTRSADRIRRSLQGTEVEAKQPQSTTSASRQKRQLQLMPDLALMVRTMRRCRGCLDTVKRGNSAWRGNTVAMMHYLRIVNSGGSQ